MDRQNSLSPISKKKDALLDLKGMGEMRFTSHSWLLSALLPFAAGRGGSHWSHSLLSFSAAGEVRVSMRCLLSLVRSGQGLTTYFLL